MHTTISASFRRDFKKRHLFPTIAALSLACNSITFAQNEGNSNSNNSNSAIAIQPTSRS